MEQFDEIKQALNPNSTPIDSDTETIPFNNVLNELDKLSNLGNTLLQKKAEVKQQKQEVSMKLAVDAFKKQQATVTPPTVSNPIAPTTDTAKSIRRNNPFNVEKGSPWKGLVDSDSDRFMATDSPEAGLRAGFINVLAKFKRGSTLAETIEILSPRSDNNPTDKMIAAAVEKSGVQPDEVISLDNHQQIKAIGLALLDFEAPQHGYSNEQIDQAVSVASAHVQNQGKPNLVQDLISASPNNELEQALSQLPADNELEKLLTPTVDLKNNSPIIKQDGNAVQHEDKTWSITLQNGQTVGFLDESTAKALAAYEDADIKAKKKGAPLATDEFHTAVNRVYGSLAFIAEEIAIGLTVGETTLNGQVDSFNTTKQNRPLLNDAATDITSNEVGTFKSIQTKLRHGDELTPADEAFIDSDKYASIADLDQVASDNRNKILNIREIGDKWRDAFPTNTKNLAGDATAVNLIAQNEGAVAALTYMIKNPTSFLKAGYDSVGYSIALTAGGPVVQTSVFAALIRSKSIEATAEFTERTGNEPTAEEQQNIDIMAGISLMAEKIGDGIVVKTFGKLVPGGQFAWAKKVQDTAIKSMPKSITDLVIFRPTKGLVKAVGGEALSGGVSEAADEFGQTKTINPAKIVVAAAQEGLALPSSVTGLTGVDTTVKVLGAAAKIATDPSTKTRTKAAITDKLTRIEELLASSDTIIFGNTENATPFIEELSKIEQVLAAADQPINADFNKEKADTPNSIFNQLYEEAKEKQKLNSEDANALARKTIRTEQAALEKRKEELVKKLEAPLSGDETAEHFTQLEKTRDGLQAVVDEGDFSKKGLEKHLKDAAKNEPTADGTEIEDKEVDAAIDDAKKSTTAKALDTLIGLSKRVIPAAKKAAVAVANNELVQKLTKQAGKLADKADDVGLFGSIGDTDADLNNARKDPKNTKHDNETIDAQLKANKAKVNIERAGDKTLKDVHDDIVDGPSQRWTGIETYKQKIVDILNNETDTLLADTKVKVIEQQMATHAENLRLKHEAFKDAKTISDNEGGREVRVVSISDKEARGPRAVRYEIPEKNNRVTSENTKAPYTTKIGKNSTRLINTVGEEVKFGASTLKVVRGYKTTSFNKRAEQAKIDKATAAEQLAQAQALNDNLNTVADPATQEDIDNLQNPEGTGTAQVQPEQDSPVEEIVEGSKVQATIDGSDVFKTSATVLKIYPEEQGETGVLLQDDSTGETTIGLLRNLSTIPELKDVKSTKAKPKQQKTASISKVDTVLVKLQQTVNKARGALNKATAALKRTKTSKSNKPFAFTKDELFTLSDPENGYDPEQIQELLNNPTFAAKQLKEQKGSGTGKLLRDLSDADIKLLREAKHGYFPDTPLFAIVHIEKLIANPDTLLSQITRLSRLANTQGETQQDIDEYLDQIDVLESLSIYDPEIGINEDGTPDGGDSTEIIAALEKLQASRTSQTTSDTSKEEAAVTSAQTALATAEAALNKRKETNNAKPKTKQKVPRTPKQTSETGQQAEPVEFDTEDSGSDQGGNPFAQQDAENTGQVPTTQNEESIEGPFGNTTDAALQWIIDNSKNESFVFIAKKIKNKVGKFPLRYQKEPIKDDDSTPAAGLTVIGNSPDGAFIDHVVLAEAGTNETVLLHELIHVAIFNKWNNPTTDKERAARKELEDIASQIETAIQSPNSKLTKAQQTHLTNSIAGINNAQELITYALTDPTLQKFMQGIPALVETESSLWSQFTKAIREFLNISDSNATVFDQVLEASNVFVNTKTPRDQIGTEITADPLENFLEVNKGKFPKTISEEELDAQAENAVEVTAKAGNKGKTKEQRIAEAAESGLGILGKSFDELVKIRTDKDGNPVTGMFSLPSSAFTSSADLRLSLVALGISEGAAEIMADEYTRFNNRYSNIKFDEQFNFGLLAGKKPLALLHIDGALPPQVVFAMAVGMMQFVQRHPTNTAFRGSYEREAFLYNDHADLTDDENTELDKLSHSYQGSVTEVGQGVATLLKIAAANTESSGYYENLVTALGLAAIQIEHGNTNSSKAVASGARLHVAEHEWGFTSVPQQEGRNFNNDITEEQAAELNKERDKLIASIRAPKSKYSSRENYPTNFALTEEINKLPIDSANSKAAKLELAYRIKIGEPAKTTRTRYKHIKIKTVNEETPFKFTDDTITALKETDQAFDLTTTDAFPLENPSKIVVKSIKNSLGQVPDEVSEVLEDLQKTPWTQAETMGIVATLAKIPSLRSAIEKLMGVKEIDKLAHESQQLSIESSNKDKIVALNEVLAANDAERLEKFYFEYRLQNQHRILMQGDINPQQSKVTRFLLRLDEPAINYTAENLHLFKQAVAFNLGVKIDKKDLAAAEAEFTTLINDKNVIEAVKILAKLKTDPVGKDAAKLAELLLEIQDDFGGNISVLSGLVALTNYMPDGTPLDSFSSDVLLEIDGISNGFAINVAQFPQFGDETEKRHQQVGTQLGPKSAELHHDTTQNDVYTDLVAAIFRNAGVDVAIQYAEDRGHKFTVDQQHKYNQRSKILSEVYKDLGDENSRDLVKYPFLIFMYGGGIKSISEGVGKKIVADLYRQLSVHNKTYHDHSPGIEQAYYEDTIRTFASQLQQLGAFNNNKGQTGKFSSKENFIESIIENKGKASQTLYFNDKVLIRDIGRVLAPRFDAGLSTMLGGTANARDAVVKAGEVLHAVFKAHYDIAYKKALGEGRTSLTKKEIDKLIEDPELLKFFPQYKGPLMTVQERAFVDLTKRELIDSISNEEVSQFAFTNNKGKKGTVGSSPRQSIFTSPGVSALIRLIINMDSAILTKTLAKYPNALMLHDAFMANPALLEKISKEYGKNYLEMNQQTSVLESINKQVKKVIADTTNSNPELITTIDNWLQNNAHENQFLGEEDPIRGLTTILGEIAAATEETLIARAERAKVVSQAGGQESFQMYLAKRNNKKKNQRKAAAIAKKPVPTKESELKKAATITVKKAKRPTKMTDTFTIKDPKGNILPNGIDVPAIIIGDFAVHKGTPQSGPNAGKFGFGTKSQITHIPSGAAVRTGMKVQEAFELAHDLVNLLADGNIDVASLQTSKQIQASAPTIKAALDAIASTDSETAKQEFVEKHGNDNSDFNTFGTLDNLHRDNPKDILVKDVDSTNITGLFTKFTEFSTNYYKSKEDMDTHTSALNRLIKILGSGMDSTTQINLTIEEIDGIAQGQYDSLRNSLRVSLSRQTPRSANGQSPQEVYVHEMLHAMISRALNDNPRIGRRVEQLYNQTKRELAGKTYRVFLEGIDSPSANDIAAAKKQYKYLFDNPTNEHNRLHEFLAYAVTNKAMIKYLSGRNIALPVRDKGLLGKLLHVVDIVVNHFKSMINRKFYKRAGTNAYQEMIAVTEQLVAIQSKHESIFQQRSKKFYNFLSATDQKIRDFGNKKSAEFVEAAPGNFIKQGLSDLATASALTMSEQAGAQGARQQMFLNLNKTLRAVANEVGGGSLSENMIERLLHAKINISKARQESERFTTEWFNKIWKSVDASEPHAMSIETREALTEVLLRADVSSLQYVGISAKQIIDLLGNRKQIAKQQADLLNKLGLKRSDKVIRYANELGYHISTGKTLLSQAHMNTYTIAHEHLEKPTNDQILLLDAYASLTALLHTDPRQIQQVKSLGLAEFSKDAKENGIIDMLDSHRLYKQNSEEHLFKGNASQMVKGFLVERVDNLTSVKTGTAADAEQFKKEGFMESYPLGNVTGVAGAHDTLYISRSIPEVPDASGIMSTTNQRNIGTTLTEILSKDPKFQTAKGNPDFTKINAEVRKFGTGQANAAKSLVDNTSLNVRPLRDDTGKIVDYRVIMDNESKKDLLRPDLEVQNVFAHMHSVYIDRKNTIDSDKAVVDLLVHEQNDMAKSHKDVFIDLLDPDGQYIDRFRKLPREVRKYIESFAVDGVFLIREDIVDKVFGFKVFDLSQLKFLQTPSLGRIKRYAGILHYLIRQIVGYGKDRIVVAMPAVVFGNIGSNIAQLTMRNIPLSYTINKTIEGFHEYQRYQKDTDELTRLSHKVASKKLGSTSPEARRITQLEISIENNKIHRMSAAGLNSLIVEDVNEAQIDGYFNKLHRTLKVDKRFNAMYKKVPKSVHDVASTMFMSKSSKPYQFSRQLVQLTDFLGRYVLIEHATKIEGMPFKQAMHKALNAFVLFDEALTPTLEALDAVGATSFISYFLRNQRASKQLVQSNPTGVGLSAAVQYATGIETLGNVNASWLSGDFSPNILQLDDLFDEANNVTGVDLLADLLSNIFS